MLIYLSSDFLSSLARIFFETRKQLVQMCIYDSSIQQMLRASWLGWFPLVARDLTFRFILLSWYYGTTDVQHRPVLKYSVPQIADIMRHRRAQGCDESLDEISHLFYEFHNYDVKTKVHVRFMMLVMANLAATLLTNPIDVCLSKILT